MRIGERIIEAGWDPLNPSAECQAALQWPRVLHRMHPKDAWGIHADLTARKLVSRFLRGTAPDEESARLMRFTAQLHVMAETTPRAEWTLEVQREVTARLDAWERTSLRPAEDRLLADARAHGADYIWRHRDRYEPALTCGELGAALNLTDIDGDVVRLGRALLTVDEEVGHGYLPADRIGRPEHVYDYFVLLTSRGHTITRVDALGRTVLDEDSTARAIRMIYRPRVEERIVPASQLGEDSNFDLFAARESPEPSPDITAEDADGLVRVMAAIQQCRASGGTARATRIVLDHLEDLLEGDVQIGNLATEHGITPQALRQAFAAQRLDLQRRLPADG